MIKQGDVFWVELGEPKGHEPGYRRPHVVVQSNVFNESKMHTVLLCTITSNLNLSKVPGNVLLRQNEGRLPKPSVVNVAQIITVDKSELTDRIGALSAARVRQIEEGIRLIIQSDM